jgi:hypothetical protein
VRECADVGYVENEDEDEGDGGGGRRRRDDEGRNVNVVDQIPKRNPSAD